MDVQEQQQMGFITGSPAPTQDEKTAAMLAHLAGIPFPILAAVLILATKGKESAWIERQAKEALNFQITVVIAYFASGFLGCLGVLVAFGVFLVAAALGVMGGLKTKDGVAYRYPFSIPLVK
jgi:hypothetical protein